VAVATQHLASPHSALTAKLRTTGLLFVTENLLLLLDNVQLGLVCFPLPHAGQHSEKMLRLTVCGCAKLWRMVWYGTGLELSSMHGSDEW
jgi:hypothetical protein